MGCTASSSEQPIEILNRCVVPGVKFEEKIIEINGSNRNFVSWVPAATEEGKQVDPKAIVLVSHGLLEHALCYYHLALPLVFAGYAVFAMDHVSHGKSDGPRGIILDHKVLYEDFITFANDRRQEYSSVPAFLIAHSLGGLIGLMSAPRITDLTAAVFSGTALVAGSGSASPFGIPSLYFLTKTSIAPILTSITASLDPGGMAAPLIASDVIWNEDELEARKLDPRRLPNIITNKTANEVQKLIPLAMENVSNVKCPILVVHGSEDNVILPESSEYIAKNAGAAPEQIRLEILPGLKHEPFSEINEKSEEAIKMVVDYFDSQMGSASRI